MFGAPTNIRPAHSCHVDAFRFLRFRADFPAVRPLGEFVARGAWALPGGGSSGWAGPGRFPPPEGTRGVRTARTKGGRFPPEGNLRPLRQEPACSCRSLFTAGYQWPERRHRFSARWVSPLRRAHTSASLPQRVLCQTASSASEGFSSHGSPVSG